MPAQAEVSDAPEVKVLSPETIAKERAAAAPPARGNLDDGIPDDPMDGARNDVVGQDGFNSMASKLEALMKEATTKGEIAKDKTTAPDASDKKQTDSKSKQPAEAKTATETPAETPTVPEHITGAKAADWKALKDLRTAAETAAKDWEQKHSIVAKEYEEFRKKAGDPAQNELTKKQLAELAASKEKLEQELKTVALERSDSFNSFYKKQFEESVTIAKDAVGKELAEQVEALMQLPPSKWRKEKLNEIREDLSIGSDQTALDNAVMAYDKARRDREDQLKDSKTNYERLEHMKMEKAESERKTSEMRQEAALAAVLSVARETSESFKRGEDKDFNAFVDEAEEFTSKFFKKKLTDTEMALLPILAMEARRYASRVVPGLEKQVKELKEALKAYKGGTPNPGSGGGTSAAATPAGGGKDFISTFNELWPAGNR